MLICLGENPISGPGGTPSHVRGVPVPGPGGYPIPCPGGVPHPRSRGVTPSKVQGGTPSHVQWVPHLRSGGYPGYTTHHLDLAGVPSPPARPGMGYSPYRDLRWGTPPPSRCGLTHKVKILPSPILRMRAVKIATNIKESFSLSLSLGVNEP